MPAALQSLLDDATQGDFLLLQFGFGDVQGGLAIAVQKSQFRMSVVRRHNSRA